MVNIHAFKYQTLLLYLSSMYWELHTLTCFYLHNKMYFEALHFFSLLPHGTYHFSKKTCNIQMSFIKVEGWLKIGTLTSSLMLYYSLQVNYRPFISTEEQRSDNKPILSGNISLLNLLPSSFNQKHQVHMHYLLFLQQKVF